MDSKLFETLVKIAGIGGLSLGVLLITFRDIIRKKIFPNLTKQQGFRLLTLIVILVWLTAIVGILSWTYVEIIIKKQPVDKPVDIELRELSAKEREYLQPLFSDSEWEGGQH